MRAFGTILCLATAVGLSVAVPAHANAYREKGKAVTVAGATMVVTPPRDWNRLDIRPGKNAETWTLDGEQLNDVTFFGGIETGQPLVRERNRKREPMPKFRSSMLLVDVPELLQGTYRAYRKIGNSTVTNARPEPFLGHPGVHFSYDYVDADNLPRKGEARAAIVGCKLYMATFDAPRLHYFDRTLADYRALADTAALVK